MAVSASTAKQNGKSRGSKRSGRKLSRSWDLFILIIPALILLAIFAYGPMYGVLMAFQDYSGAKGILGSEWVGPSQGQLDPVKEITAEILACEQGFSTREQSTVRLNGGTWDRNVEQLEKENEKLAGIQKTPEGAGGVYSQTKNTMETIKRMVIADQIRRAGGD